MARLSASGDRKKGSGRKEAYKGGASRSRKGKTASGKEKTGRIQRTQRKTRADRTGKHSKIRFCCRHITEKRGLYFYL